MDSAIQSVTANQVFLKAFRLFCMKCETQYYTEVAAVSLNTAGDGGIVVYRPYFLINSVFNLDANKYHSMIEIHKTRVIEKKIDSAWLCLW